MAFNCVLQQGIDEVGFGTSSNADDQKGTWLVWCMNWI